MMQLALPNLNKDQLAIVKVLKRLLIIIITIAVVTNGIKSPSK